MDLKKMNIWPVAICLFFVGGCANNDGGMVMSAIPDIDGGEVVQITGTIKDASVQKEALYLKARTDRDKQYASMYKESGMSLEFEMIEVKPGIFIQVLKSASHKAMPQFAQDMPTGPSEHPVWKTVNKGLEIAQNVTLGWFVLDGLKAWSDTPTYDYSGGYTSNSYNPSTSTSTSTSTGL